MADIFAINIEDSISVDVYQRLLSLVSQKRRERIKKYKFEVDAKRSLLASVLVRYIACCKLNIKNEDINFYSNEYGKPYLDGVKSQCFNVSHSGEWVVCGWSAYEIGIDVEVLSDIDLDIAKNCFSEVEYLSILKTKIDEQKKMFFDIWTLKESYIKYKGLGLSIPLNSFQFDLSSENIKLISNDKKKPLFYRIKLDENHKLAVCTEDTEVVGITQVSSEIILSKLSKQI